MSKQMKCLYLAIMSLFAVLACSFHSLNASALDIVQNVDFKESVQSPYYRLTFTDNTVSSWSNSTYDGASTSKNTGLIWLRGSNNATPSTLSNGVFVSSIVRFAAPGYFNMINTSGAFTASTYDSSCPLVSIDNVTSSYYNDDSTNATTESWNVFVITCKYTGSGDISMPINIRTSSASFNNWKILPISFSIWSKSPNGATSSDVEAVKNAVNSMSTAIQNKQNTTNSKLDQLKLSIDDLNSAQEQANNDANQRYQDEKDTISDSTNEGQTTMENSNAGVAFTLINPFQFFFSLFSSDCSVPLGSTLRNWLTGGKANRLPDTYTSWWCVDSSVRSARDTVTIVLSFLGVILTFKFLWRWLATNEGEN